jgi:hypothetical protein
MHEVCTTLCCSFLDNLYTFDKKTENPYRFGRNMLKERKSIMVQLLKANRKKCSRWWTYDWMKLFFIF